jgi:LPS-assembly protein
VDKRRRYPSSIAILLWTASSAQALPANDWGCSQSPDSSGWQCVPTQPTAPVRPPDHDPDLFAANNLNEPAAVEIAPFETQPPACGPTEPTPTEAQGPLIAASPTGETKMYADHVGGTENRFVLTGNVDIVRGNQRLRANQVIYDKQENREYAIGDVLYTQPGLELRGAKGYKEIEGDRGEFEGVQYELPRRGARGTADQAELLSQSQSQLNRVTYTTCLPTKKDWELQARKVNLDQETDVGTARDAKIEFQGVPIFYTPYITFPLSDKRKSGFLVPSLGNSDNSGTDISVPYYWNIAPNRDATITPRILSKRGLQLIGEYRYLHPTSRGELGIEYLPNDRLFGDSRSLFTYRERGNFGPNWSSDVNLNRVSDRTYFEDLGQTLRVSSTTNLEQRADARYGSGNWSVLTRLQAFQPVGTTPESYRRLPQVVAQAAIPSNNDLLTYQLYGEAVRFDHANDAVPVGTRLDLNPGITADFRRPGYYLTPRLRLRYTQYSLTNQGIGNSSTPTRSVPISSVEGGLYLERSLTWGSTPFLQTLEPRIYYLYVPYRNQSDIPVFDTSLLDFSFAQLFRDNRFSSADRVGDANQLSLALTSRFLQTETGAERLRASIGQIYYFEDRRVTLPGQSVETADSSDVVGEIAMSTWSHSTATALLQWDPHQHQLNRGVLEYRYQPEPRRILNLAYQYRRNDYQQTDVSAVWPMAARWLGVARWNYSIRDRLTLESLAGVEYDSCCWGARLVIRRYVGTVGGTPNNAIYLQLVLKGLTSIGNKIEDLLGTSILGYGSTTSVQ